MALLLIKNPYAGDYYAYQDPNGNLVISNNVPPPESKIIRKETLSEVTDQQISESEYREGGLDLITGFRAWKKLSES